MKNLLLLSVLALSVVALASGCSPSFWGGGAAGIVGTGAGYEVHARSEMRRIEDDLRAGRIDQREYDIRKNQIERDSLLQ